MKTAETKTLPSADKENSRFKWKINLPFGEKQPYIIGYSKFNGNPEAADAFSVFKSKIIMLHQKAYIDRCTTIEFYNNQTLQLLVLLTKDKFDIAPKLLASKQYEFLKSFYEYRRKGLKMDELLSPKIGFSKDEYLDPNKLGLVSIGRLKEYCSDLLSMGFSKQQVDNYRINYGKMFHI